MARAKARTLNIFGQIVIIKRNPWYSERLFKALMSIGKKPKKPEKIFSAPVAWFMDPTKMPPGVYERAKMFSEVASVTAGRPIEERLRIIQERLRTGRKPRPPRIKAPGTRFHELYPTYEALRGVAVAPIPAPPVVKR